MKKIILVLVAMIGLQAQAHKVNNGVIAEPADISCYEEIKPNEFRDSIHNVYLHHASPNTYRVVLVKRSMVSGYEVLRDFTMNVRTDIRPTLPALFLISQDGQVSFNMNIGFPGQNMKKFGQYTDRTLNLSLDLVCENK